MSTSINSTARNVPGAWNCGIAPVLGLPPRDETVAFSFKESIFAKMSSREVMFGSGLIVLALLAISLFIRIPLRTGYLGNVSVAVTGFETNTTGVVIALVPVSNKGDYEVKIAVGTEVLKTNDWVDGASGLPHATSLSLQSSPLEAGKETIVRVPVPNQKPWRVCVLCQKEYKARLLRSFMPAIDIFFSSGKSRAAFIVRLYSDLSG